MNDALKQHYQELYQNHGGTSSAVQYRDRASHFKRFEILCEGVNVGQNTSIIDVGCGLGHLCGYLLSKGWHGRYLGLDFVPEFVEFGRQAYKDHPSVQFELFDIWKDPIPAGYDFVLLSGVFNNKMPENEAFMIHSIRQMFAAAEKGIGFNAMSTYVDFYDDELYYSDPLKIFDLCKRELSRKVTLRHDYIVKEGSIPYEYAIFVFK